MVAEPTEARGIFNCPAPVVIGATGGSGTRVVARLAERAGFYLGSYLNEASDALAFRPFHDRWINPFLSAKQSWATGPARTGRRDRGEHAPSEKLAKRMSQDFYAAVEQHVGSSLIQKGAHWGWKAPRSIYLLPFLHGRYPGLQFIHVLRDGRDMAFSKNQNQLHKHGFAVLSWRERWFHSQPFRSILLWDRVNLRAAEYGDMHLGKNYLPVRFEDLCERPVETTQCILRFLGANLDPEAIARAEIFPPASLGRWRMEAVGLISKLERAAAISLRKFGYL